MIWKGRRLGYSVSKIAKEVGRSKSTISRELRRNANSGADWIELSHQAQEKAKHRRIQANRSRTRLKAIWIQKYVEERLKSEWTPELIAIRLKEVDRAAGIIITRQRPGTAKGVVFITLEDETGSLTLIIRPKIFAQCHKLVTLRSALGASGRLERIGEIVYIDVLRIESIKLN